MKAILGLFVVIGGLIVSCTALKPAVCNVQTKAESIVVSEIVSHLECSNSAAVEASVAAGIAKLNVCPAQGKQGPIADAVCPAVSQFAANFLASQAVPAAWGCASTSARSALAAAIQKACVQLPLAEQK